MGNFFSSKAKVEVLETIEANVVELSIRTDEDEGYIDYYVKNQISKALCFYKNQIDVEMKNGHISGRKAGKLKDMIDSTINKIEDAATTKYELKNIDTGESSLDQIRSQLLDIEKSLERREFHEDQCEDLLKTFALCAESLSRLDKMLPDEENTFSSLFLNIFLKLPRTRISTILTTNLNNLNKIIENFELIDMKRLIPSDIEEIESVLEEIKSKVRVIDDLVEKGLNEIEEQLIGFNIDEEGYFSDEASRIQQYQYLKLVKINEDLHECNRIVKELWPPVGERTVRKLKDKVTILTDNIHLNETPASSSDIVEKQIILKRKSNKILIKLEYIDSANNKIFANLKTLKNVEDAIHADVSTLSFQEKKSFFQSHTSIVRGIIGNNDEVEIRKIVILNKINGCFIVEALHYLRQINQKLDYYEIYAQHFGYPSRIDIYKNKCEEINSLRKDLTGFPEFRVCLAARLRIIKHRIGEVLDVLSNKSQINDVIISTMERLDNLKAHVVCFTSQRSNKYYLRKLRLFNEFRGEKDMIVNNIDKRIIAKKMEIILELQTCEEEILEKCPKFVQEIKRVLNEYEKDAVQFIHPLSSDIYQEKKVALIQLRQKIRSEMFKCNLNYEIGMILEKTASFTLNLLECNAKCNQESRESLERLNTLVQNVNILLESVSLSCSEKIERLKQFELTVKNIKKSMEKIGMLNQTSAVEARIRIEKNKINLVLKSCDLKNIIEDINEMIRPIPTYIFKKILDQIFLLKESVEDMVDDDSELDAEKLNFLQKLYDVLRELDEHVAKIAFSQKPSNQILELHVYFSDLNPDYGGSKNSLEFVQMIYEKAKSFEERIRYYLGARSSVDYYVIHENLLRFLEELDKLTCKDDQQLLNKVVEVMDFIKSLITQLDGNCCDE